METKNMELTLLGSGTTVPLTYRCSPSLMIGIHGDYILFDLGPGAVRQLARIGLNLNAVSHIFLTHFHPDHTSDLIHFLFASKSPSIPQRSEPVMITGPRGLSEFVHRLQAAYDPYLTLPTGIMEIEEIDACERVENDYKKFKTISVPTKHTPESIAYRFETKAGKSIVYSGDTSFCDEIVELSREADLLILEASFPDGQEVEGHLTPSLAGHIAALANVKRLLLTHLYPECLETDISAQCRKYYTGELIIGTDLLQLRI
jgi:ribonuclease BN (tRNA processing enzyme)